MLERSRSWSGVEGGDQRPRGQGIALLGAADEIEKHVAVLCQSLCVLGPLLDAGGRIALGRGCLGTHHAEITEWRRAPPDARILRIPRLDDRDAVLPRERDELLAVEALVPRLDGVPQRSPAKLRGQ